MNCKQCQLDKPQDMFYKTGNGGFCSICKTCTCLNKKHIRACANRKCRQCGVTKAKTKFVSPVHRCCKQCEDSNTRLCIKCNAIKPVAEFYLRNHECTTCTKKRIAQLRAAKSVTELQVAARKNHLQTRYGLTPEDYDIMAKAQNHRCAICQVHVTKCLRRHLCVDHSHKLGGKIRGLLCYHCNAALGNFFDRQDLLQTAIKYLQKYQL